MSLAHFIPSLPESLDRPACPKCGDRMMLALIEPLSGGFDQRSFECKACDYEETIVVKFR